VDIAILDIKNKKINFENIYTSQFSNLPLTLGIIKDKDNIFYGQNL
jgi:hypothetical protein